MHTLTLEQKIFQMFITGFHGTNPDTNECFKYAVKNGLGGVIFFSHNIETKEQFKDLITSLKKEAILPMFYSIDQEGGRVERTEAIHGGKKYLSAKFAYEKGCDFLKEQTKEIAQELKYYGINMNFAPVSDVNTNPDNPIIGERAFSDNPEDVKTAADIVINEYEKAGIIPVSKHFPGHGAASADSHKTLPVIDLPFEELEKIHIEPFKSEIEKGLPAIMVAHVIYPCLDPNNPASVSKSVISDLLTEKLGFDGIIMTDDMEMNGIKGMTRLEACTKAINAGITMFIYRDTDENILKLVKDLENNVKTGIISEERINKAIAEITKIKRRFNIV